MSTNNRARANAFLVRPWHAGDDAALVALLRLQMERDPGWPPDYARGGDLASWLGAPATLGRWVATDAADVPVGHVGNAPVHTGPFADLWSGALACDLSVMAEVCRLVVDPRRRRSGLSDLMTRRAVRAAVESGYVPVANALSDRDASLTMMTNAGWRSVGTAISPRTGRELVALIPPQKLIDAAIAARRALSDR